MDKRRRFENEEEKNSEMGQSSNGLQAEGKE